VSVHIQRPANPDLSRNTSGDRTNPSPLSAWIVSGFSRDPKETTLLMGDIPLGTWTMGTFHNVCVFTNGIRCGRYTLYRWQQCFTVFVARHFLKMFVFNAL